MGPISLRSLLKHHKTYFGYFHVLRIMFMVFYFSLIFPMFMGKLTIEFRSTEQQHCRLAGAPAAATTVAIRAPAVVVAAAEMTTEQ